MIILQQKFEKGTELWQMMADINRFLSDHWVAETTDEYWASFQTDASKLIDKYRDYDYTYIINILDAFMNIQEIKLKTSNCKIGDVFEYHKRTYEVIKGGAKLR